jgi:hypothetical protein
MDENEVHEALLGLQQAGVVESDGNGSFWLTEFGRTAGLVFTDDGGALLIPASSN